MEHDDLDHLDDALPVWFEPCAGFTADPLGGSEICAHCGWLDADHDVHDVPVVIGSRPVLPRAA